MALFYFDLDNIDINKTASQFLTILLVVLRKPYKILVDIVVRSSKLNLYLDKVD